MLICISSPYRNPKVVFQMDMSGPKMGPPSFGEGHGERFGGNSGCLRLTKSDQPGCSLMMGPILLEWSFKTCPDMICCPATLSHPFGGHDLAARIEWLDMASMLLVFWVSVNFQERSRQHAPPRAGREGWTCGLCVREPTLAPCSTPMKQGDDEDLCWCRQFCSLFGCLVCSIPLHSFAYLCITSQGRNTEGRHDMSWPQLGCKHPEPCWTFVKAFLTKGVYFDDFHRIA